jgi:hypothetical protein
LRIIKKIVSRSFKASELIVICASDSFVSDFVLDKSLPLPILACSCEIIRFLFAAKPREVPSRLTVVDATIIIGSSAVVEIVVDVPISPTGVINAVQAQSIKVLFYILHSFHDDEIKVARAKLAVVVRLHVVKCSQAVEAGSDRNLILPLQNVFQRPGACLIEGKLVLIESVLLTRASTAEKSTLDVDVLVDSSLEVSSCRVKTSWGRVSATIVETTRTSEPGQVRLTDDSGLEVQMTIGSWVFLPDMALHFVCQFLRDLCKAFSVLKFMARVQQLLNLFDFEWSDAPHGVVPPDKPTVQSLELKKFGSSYCSGFRSQQHVL